MRSREKAADSSGSSGAEMDRKPGSVTAVGSLFLCCRQSSHVDHSRNRCDFATGSSLPPGKSLKRLTGCTLVAPPAVGTNHSLNEDLGSYWEFPVSLNSAGQQF